MMHISCLFQSIYFQKTEERKAQVLPEGANKEEVRNLVFDNQEP